MKPSVRHDARVVHRLVCSCLLVFALSLLNACGENESGNDAGDGSSHEEDSGVEDAGADDGGTDEEGSGPISSRHDDDLLALTGNRA